MQFKEHQFKDKESVALYLEGRLDAVCSTQFEKMLSDYLTLPKPPHVILDFTQISYLSSAGLRVILSTHKALTRHNRKLFCVSFTEEVFEIIKMAGFDKVLNIADSVDDAVKSIH